MTENLNSTIFKHYYSENLQINKNGTFFLSVETSIEWKKAGYKLNTEKTGNYLLFKTNKNSEYKGSKIVIFQNMEIENISENFATTETFTGLSENNTEIFIIQKVKNRLYLNADFEYIDKEGKIYSHEITKIFILDE